jgi:S-phase kinase-associated protein 1
MPPQLSDIFIFLVVSSSFTPTLVLTSHLFLAIPTSVSLSLPRVADKEERQIPLPNVKSKILAKVIEYMRYHAGNPAKEIDRPLKSANMREVVSEWDADYVEVDDEMLFDLILAANYMDIKPLLDLTCAKVASYMKGKTAEEIRKRFNIENDLTPEEEAAIRAENKWAEES